jgi:poly-gamma-glutamate synthesis protein (capsule biosynthesis protein)
MKKIKIIITFLLIVLAVGISTQLGTGEAVVKDERTKVLVYYVPVTNYFSERANINTDDFKTEKAVVLGGDALVVAELLGTEAVETVENVTALQEKVGSGRVAIVRWNQVTPNLKTLTYNNKLLWKKSDVAEYGLRSEALFPESEALEISFDSSKLTKINFLGDIMLSRHVNTQMKKLGYDYPWEKVKDITADADITFANLEVPISDRYNAPSEGMSFVAPTKNLEYLKLAGIDVVSVANNHTANFGKQAFLDNLNNLKGAGINICGGGLAEAEARTATVITANGLNFNFLCQSAVVGSLYADGEGAGVPYLGLEPWYRRNQNSLDDLVADIDRARLKEGVVIDSPHWGVEYKHYPNTDQQAAARLMIDAGVDLVIGTHPHVVQSLEYYNGKYINYSLGNFIFDQEWSTATKQGVMASAYFYQNRNVSVTLSPLQIENYAQPSFISGEVAKSILSDIEESSKGF